VWPLDRSTSNEYLRIGRHALERWTDVGGALSLVANHQLEPEAIEHPPSLGAAIRTLCPDASGKRITLLLESAWLPVMLIDTGPALLSAAQLDALVRHRFGLHHGDTRDPVSAWELRVEHRAGHRHALAYGVSTRVKQALMDAGEATGLEWGAMLPAFSWGRQRLLVTQRWARTNGWRVWQEQDRMLVARFARNELVGFNAGAARVDDEAGVLRLIDAEEVRFGVAPNADAITVAIWDGAKRTPRVGDRVTWHDVRGLGSLNVSAPSNSQAQVQALT
jgi:hypothetical protein